MRRIPNATFVNSRKRARSPCSDGWDAVHTYGSLSLSKGEGRVRIYSPDWRLQGSNQKSTTMDCMDQLELETQHRCTPPARRG